MKQKKWSRLAKIRTASFLAAGFLVLLGFAVQGHARAGKYERLLNNSYQHAFAELTTAAGELDTALQKASYATTPALFSSLCAQAYSKALSAQMALGELPYGNVELEQTAGFFAKAGDYAMALSRGAYGDQVCAADERETLNALASAASSLAGTLRELQAGLYDGAVTLEDLETAQQRLASAAEGTDSLTAGSAFQTVEADFPEVPSLVYDGPFSEHLSSRTPQMLAGLPQTSQEEAQAAAAYFLGLRSDIFTFTGQGEGVLPTYAFTATVDGGELYVEVTQQGAQVLQVISSRPIAQAALDRDAAIQAAAEFLDQRGYPNMEPSYSIDQGNALTIHFAAVQDGVYCYPDLVKVTVALDTGGLIGFEAHGYLMNHHTRDLPAPAVSREQAQALIGNSLKVLSHQLVLIPTGGEYEVFCREFKCEAENGAHVLVYVNAATGQEESILLLLEDESGTLAI